MSTPAIALIFVIGCLVALVIVGVVIIARENSRGYGVIYPPPSQMKKPSPSGPPAPPPKKTVVNYCPRCGNRLDVKA